MKLQPLPEKGASGQELYVFHLGFEEVKTLAAILNNVIEHTSRVSDTEQLLNRCRNIRRGLNSALMRQYLTSDSIARGDV